MLRDPVRWHEGPKTLRMQVCKEHTPIFSFPDDRATPSTLAPRARRLRSESFTALFLWTEKLPEYSFAPILLLSPALRLLLCCTSRETYCGHSQRGPTAPALPGKLLRLSRYYNGTGCRADWARATKEWLQKTAILQTWKEQNRTCSWEPLRATKKSKQTPLPNATCRQIIFLTSIIHCKIVSLQSRNETGDNRIFSFSPEQGRSQQRNRSRKDVKGTKPRKVPRFSKAAFLQVHNSALSMYSYL